ncbi:LuxR C-terminal-related transcriptional regulator [Streptomyces sp. NPDC058739]|uniref:LuxR C-terminal-related transcriptional regulator n=1 Tax=Streptomyces sp. NPDC058739 TaxID=3346618 RepID=UPI0036C410DD
MSKSTVDDARARHLLQVPSGSEATEDEVLRKLLGGVPDGELLDFAAGAGGSLRLLTEFALGLVEEELVEECDGVVRLVERRIPRRVALFVRRRLDELSLDCRHFLKIAAVLGRSFLLEDVSRMLDRSSAGLLSVLDEAIDSGFVVASEHRLAFPSGFLLHGITESIPAPARGALRREAAGRRGGDTGSRELWGPGQGEVPQPPSGPSRVPRSDTADGAAEPFSRAHGLVVLGRAEAGVRLAESILADPGISSAARLDAEASMILGYSVLDMDRAEEHAERVLRERRGGQGDVASLMAMASLSNVRWRAGELAEGLSLGRIAARYSDDIDPLWRVHFQLALAGKLANLREFDKAEKLIGESEAGLQALPVPVWRAGPAAVRARMLLQAGRFGEARVQAELVTGATGADAVPTLLPVTHCVLAAVSLYVGDVSTAVEHMQRAERELGADRTVVYSPQYAWTDVRVAVKREGPRAAVELFAGKYSHLPTLRSLYIEDPAAAPFLVRLARDVGDSELKRSVLETVDGLAEDNPGISVVVLGAVHANALANGDAAGLSRVVAQSPDPISVALATEELARLYGARVPHQRRSPASPPSAPTGSRPGEAPHAAGPAEALSPAAPPNSMCWAGLSDMERRISYLVSTGMTNRQIAKRVHLSAHTVNYHLRKIYRKLDINTRVELARGAATYASSAAIYSVEDEGISGAENAGGGAL